jgi:RNA-directed DNA polymerase
LQTAYAHHRLNGLPSGKTPRGHVTASNRTGEISLSGMIVEDTGNGLRHGTRHRRSPDKEPETATPRGPPELRLSSTRVFDLWVQRWRQKQARGDVIVVRFADDFVVGFEHRVEAERFLAELRERFTRFGLELHPEKTRLIEFGRRARRNREDRGDRGAPGSFNFLGFTHSCGKTRKGGFTVLRQTMRKRWQAKLKAVKAELKARMHDPIPEVGKYLRSVVLGHVRYYGVPMNGPAITAFRRAVGLVWWRVLRRRSQGNHFPLRRMWPLLQTWLPPARICHPYPSQRLRVRTQGGSRMR